MENDNVTTNLDEENQKAAQEQTQDIERKTDEGTRQSNEELEAQQLEESLQEQEKKQIAEEYGKAARSKTVEPLDTTTQGPEITPPTEHDGKNISPDAGAATTATQDDKVIDENQAKAPENRTTQQSEKGARNDVVNNNNQKGNNVEGATKESDDPDALEGVYATEEMFRARHVVQPFYLSDRCKNTWKECMAGFNAAKDPAEAVEELFWGFINMAPKMAIAYMFHLDDQEIARKKAAQDDKESYDKQLLLMKQLSQADFHKLKCDWIFGSEEFHQHLKERMPDLPQDKYGYIDISTCSNDEKKMVREEVETFIKENPYYKNMIENFTHREFAQDEINREAIGLSYAIHHLNGRPKNLYKDGKPVDRPAPPAPVRPQKTDAINAAATQKQDTQGQPQRGPLKNVTPANIDSLQQLGQSVISSLRSLNKQMKENSEILASIRDYQYNGVAFQTNTQQTPGRTATTAERV